MITVTADELYSSSSDGELEIPEEAPVPVRDDQPKIDVLRKAIVVAAERIRKLEKQNLELRQKNTELRRRLKELESDEQQGPRSIARSRKRNVPGDATPLEVRLGTTATTSKCLSTWTGNEALSRASYEELAPAPMLREDDRAVMSSAQPQDDDKDIKSGDRDRMQAGHKGVPITQNQLQDGNEENRQFPEEKKEELQPHRAEKKSRRKAPAASDGANERKRRGRAVSQTDAEEDNSSYNYRGTAAKGTKKRGREPERQATAEAEVAESEAANARASQPARGEMRDVEGLGMDVDESVSESSESEDENTQISVDNIDDSDSELEGRAVCSDPPVPAVGTEISGGQKAHAAGSEGKDSAGVAGKRRKRSARPSAGWGSLLHLREAPKVHGDVPETSSSVRGTSSSIPLHLLFASVTPANCLSAAAHWLSRENRDPSMLVKRVVEAVSEVASKFSIGRALLVDRSAGGTGDLLEQAAAAGTGTAAHGPDAANATLDASMGAGDATPGHVYQPLTLTNVQDFLDGIQSMLVALGTGQARALKGSQTLLLEVLHCLSARILALVKQDVGGPWNSLLTSLGGACTYRTLSTDADSVHRGQPTATVNGAVTIRDEWLPGRGCESTSTTTTTSKLQSLLDLPPDSRLTALLSVVVVGTASRAGLAGIARKYIHEVTLLVTPSLACSEGVSSRKEPAGGGQNRGKAPASATSNVPAKRAYGAVRGIVFAIAPCSDAMRLLRHSDLVTSNRPFITSLPTPPLGAIADVAQLYDILSKAMELSRDGIHNDGSAGFLSKCAICDDSLYGPETSASIELRQQLAFRRLGLWNCMQSIESAVADDHGRRVQLPSHPVMCSERFGTEAASAAQPLRSNIDLSQLGLGGLQDLSHVMLRLLDHCLMQDQNQVTQPNSPTPSAVSAVALLGSAIRGPIHSDSMDPADRQTAAIRAEGEKNGAPEGIHICICHRRKCLRCSVFLPLLSFWRQAMASPTSDISALAEELRCFRILLLTTLDGAFDYINGGWRAGSSGSGLALESRFSDAIRKAKEALTAGAEIVRTAVAVRNGDNVASNALETKENCHSGPKVSHSSALAGIYLRTLGTVPEEMALGAARLLDEVVALRQTLRSRDDPSQGQVEPSGASEMATLDGVARELAALLSANVLEVIIGLGVLSARAAIAVCEQYLAHAAPTSSHAARGNGFDLANLLRESSLFLSAMPAPWAGQGRADTASAVASSIRLIKQLETTAARAPSAMVAGSSAPRAPLPFHWRIPSELSFWVDDQAHRIPVFLINLDRRRDRLMKMFQQAQSHGLILIRVPAVDGRFLASLHQLDDDVHTAVHVEAPVAATPAQLGPAFDKSGASPRAAEPVAQEAGNAPPDAATSCAFPLGSLWTQTTSGLIYVADSASGDSPGAFPPTADATAAEVGERGIPVSDVVLTWDSRLNSNFDRQCVPSASLPMTFSERGCAASHLKVWRTIAALRGSLHRRTHEPHPPEGVHSAEALSQLRTTFLRAQQGGGWIPYISSTMESAPPSDAVNDHEKAQRSLQRNSTNPPSGATDWYLIMEDDAHIVTPLFSQAKVASSPSAQTGHIGASFRQQLARVISLLPGDWDICYLGWAIPWVGRNIDKRQKWRQRSLFHKPSYLWMLHAYVLRGRAVDILLAALPINAPVDNFIAELIHDGRLTAYAVRDKLATQEGTTAQRQAESDIRHSGRVQQARA